MPKKKKTVHVIFIQDRSGSMMDAWDEAVSGFKAFIKDLRKGGKEDKINYCVSLTMFDTQVDQPLKAVPIEGVNPDIIRDYGPRGMTALYDAVGRSLQDTPAEISEFNPDSTLCVIATDGLENSSREWTKDRVHSLIDSKLQTGNWTFQYLGTQPETWDEAAGIGIGRSATAAYDSHRAGSTYQLLAQSANTMYRSGAMSSTSLFSDFGDKESLKQSGVELSDD